MINLPMINIDINIVEKSWRMENPKIRKNIKSLFEKIVPQTKLSAYLKQNISLVISLLLTNDKQIRQLNCDYRKQNKATNVLSFPLWEKEMPKKTILLGDIILSYETIKKEALEQNKIFLHHLSHLLIHSLLHLIGYDHIIKKDAAIMERLEIKLLKTLNINNPYII